jgi:hypothetical protein
MEQRAAIKFYVKLKKTATETFEMSKIAYDDECLSRKSVFEWYKCFKSSSESANTKNPVENNVDCIFFYAEGIIQYEFVPENQKASGKIF